MGRGRGVGRGRRVSRGRGVGRGRRRASRGRAGRGRGRSSSRGESRLGVENHGVGVRIGFIGGGGGEKVGVSITEKLPLSAPLHDGGGGEEGAGLEGEQVNVDYGNWEKKAAESVTKKLESTREMPVQQVARTITLVLVVHEPKA